MKTTLIKIKAALLAIRARFTPGTGSIVAQFDKLMATIEAAIAKDDLEVGVLEDQICTAEQRLFELDESSGRASRMLIALRAIA